MAMEVSPAKAGASDRPDAVSVSSWSRWVLAGLVTTLVVVAMFPWQRACDVSDAGGSFAHCYQAAMWSGGGWLFGLLALALAGPVAWWLLRDGLRRSAASPGSLLLLGGFVAAVLAKLISSLSTHPAIGAHVGLVLIVAAAYFSLLLLAEGSPVGVERPVPLRSRSWVALLTGALIVSAAFIPYRWAGLARWGGPASSFFQGDGGGVSQGMWHVQVGTELRVNGLVDILNRGHVPFTVDSVELVDATTGLRLVGAYAIDIHSPCVAYNENEVPPIGSMEGIPCAPSVAGTRVGTAAAPDNQAFISLVVRPEQPGRFWFCAVAVHYHVGLLHYTTIQDVAIGMCTVPPGPGACKGW